VRTGVNDPHAYCQIGLDGAKSMSRFRRCFLLCRKNVASAVVSGLARGHTWVHPTPRISEGFGFSLENLP
jgi:hypothetical protein